MTDAIAWMAFGIPLPEDSDFTKGLEENINDLLNYELEHVFAAAKMIRDQLDQLKAEYAGHFQTTVDYFRTHPLTDDCFTEMLVTGLKNRLEVRDKVPPVAQIVASLSAYREFEFEKLKLAVANKDYKVEKHRNDLVDSEQLVYLKDPNLHFMTADRGYLRKVVKSPFRSGFTKCPVICSVMARNCRLC